MTSTGFSVTDYTVWPLYPKVILTLLAIVGACAGSTCGSLKISRVIILMKTAFANLRRLSSPRSIKSIKMDKNLKETVSDVNAFVTIYVLILIVSVVLLSLDSDSITAAGSAAVAALSNVGIGFGSVGTTGDVSFFPVFKVCTLL